MRPRPYQAPESKAGPVPDNPFGRKPDFGSLDRLRGLLRRFGLRADDRLGQRFLADERVLREIAGASGAREGADVVEIGSGIGNLTTMLLLSGAHVTGLELDRRFLEIHREIVAGRLDLKARHELVQGDALEFDFSAAAQRSKAAGRPFIIAGNIPYQITSPLIMRILESGTEFEAMTLLVQLEVADRLSAAPGTRETSAFSVKVSHWCEVERLFAVPSFAFMPEPRVHSAVIRFHRRPGVTGERPVWFRLVEAAFSQRRKTVPNAVAASGLGFGRERVEKALEAIGQPINVRAERLTSEQFAALYEALHR